MSPIYLDNQATTPTDPRVVDAMLPFLGRSAVGNPHSDHVAGRRAESAVAEARARVAELIGALPQEIIFTSGATEANNIALLGVARSTVRRGNHIVTCSSEHQCVIDAARHLRENGFRVTFLPIERSGLVNLDALSRAVDDETALVSVMMANNEIGVLQPTDEVAEICRSRGVVFHCDAAQAAGKIPIDVHRSGIDLMSMSAHKLYAPIGIGALFISEQSPVVPEAIAFGGGQERGIRSGTIAPHLCVAFGKAASIARREIANDAAVAAGFRDRFLQIVRDRIADVVVNGEGVPRLPGNLSLTIPGVDADRLVGALQPDIAVSTNAACSSGTLMPSHVLLALGLDEEAASSTLRIGFGRFNTRSEVETAAERLSSAALRIRIGDPAPLFTETVKCATVG